MIDNINFLRMLVRDGDGAIGGIDRHNMENLAEFKRTGKRQIIILNTSTDFAYGDQHSNCFHYICENKYIFRHYNSDMVMASLDISLYFKIPELITNVMYRLYDLPAAPLNHLYTRDKGPPYRKGP